MLKLITEEFAEDVIAQVLFNQYVVMMVRIMLILVKLNAMVLW